RADQSARPGLLPRLRHVEDAGPMDVPQRPGPRTADTAGGDAKDQVRRRDPAGQGSRPDAGATVDAALCDDAGRTSAGLAQSPGTNPATTVAIHGGTHHRVRAGPGTGHESVVTTFPPNRPCRPAKTLFTAELRNLG